jgi:hypothetical protein
MKCFYTSAVHPKRSDAESQPFKIRVGNTNRGVTLPVVFFKQVFEHYLVDFPLLTGMSIVF